MDCKNLVNKPALPAASSAVEYIEVASELNALAPPHLPNLLIDLPNHLFHECLGGLHYLDSCRGDELLDTIDS